MGLELPKYPEMNEDEVTDSEVVYHVKNALTSVLSDEKDSYNQLIGVVHMHQSKRLAPDAIALLETTLRALAGAVSCIDFTAHQSLLSTIFNMSMWNNGPQVADALAEVIESLAISNGKYLDCCLGMLVSNFTPPPHFLDKLKLPHGLDRKRQVLDRVHAAFKRIYHYVPLVPLRLLSIVIQRMPTIYHKDKAILIYVENMLKLESGEIGEIVGSTLLMAVVDRLIDLDLEIGWDAILVDDFSKGIFEMELEDEDEIVESSEKQPGEFRLSRKTLAGNSIAELLDNLLVLTFEHLESCERAGRLAEVFDTLLKSFQVTVMTAYKSKFTQFVIFYACALDPENCGIRFATLLADLFVQDSHQSVTRMTAASYLASYLSRAKFLSASFIASMLNRLIDWCLEYRKTHDGETNPNADRVFYSGCQAIMYVLCFRMKVFMDVPRLKSQVLMPLEQILNDPKLNPLKVCLPSVVQEFLQQSKAACLFTGSESFIFDGLLESELSKAFGGLERLDTFFPFDPCLLKGCDSFIRPMFVYWSMVKPKCDDGEDENDDDELLQNVVNDSEDELLQYVVNDSEDELLQNFVNDSEDELLQYVVNDSEDEVSRSFDEQGLDLDDFDYALSKMSITPKDRFSYKFGGRFRQPTRMPSKIRPSTSPESL